MTAASQLPEGQEFDYVRKMIAVYRKKPDTARITTISLMNGREVTGPVIGAMGELVWALGPYEFPYIGREVRPHPPAKA